MIKLTSNVKQFSENYKKKAYQTTSALNGLAEKLAKRMSNDMKESIQKDRRWQEHGNLSRIDNVDFRSEIINSNTVRVHIGENLPKFGMKDGTLVNPAFFIEFGFGIVGQQNPKQNHSAYNWEYNISGHKESWFFWYDGILMESEGREGLNFIYNIMQEYKNNWKKYLSELILEMKNG